MIMKLKNPLIAFTALGIAFTARASDLYWSGTGTWDTTTQNWGTTDGGPYDATIWNNSTPDSAFFQGAAGTVTLGTPITASGLDFGVTGYTVTGGTLTLGGSPLLTVRTGTASLSSAVSAASGATKAGAGTLVVTASNAGWNNGATVSAGILQLNNQTAVGSGTITLGDTDTGASDVQLTLHTNVNRAGFNNDIIVANQGTGSASIKIVDSGSAQGTGSGTITLNRAATIDATQISASYMLINHAFSGAGEMTVSSTSGRRFLLQVASPDFTGNITLQSGAVFEPRNQLASNTGNSVTVESGGELRLNFDATTIGGLSGSGLVRRLLGSPSLTIGKGDADGDFSGTLTGAMPLTKTGAGTQILSGTNTYTGTTTISGGTLRIGDGGTTGALPGNAVNNATLAFDRSNDYTYSGNISGTGAVTQSGTGTLTLSGANTYTGATTVEAGILNLTGSLTSAVTATAGTVLTGAGSSTGSLTMAAGSSFGISGTSGTSFNGVTLGGTTYLEFLTTPVESTVYDVVSYGAGGITNFGNLSPLARGTLADDAANNKITFTSGPVGTRTWNTTDGTWDRLGTLTNWTEGDQVFYNGDSPVFGDIATNATVTLEGSLVSGNDVVVSNAANTYTFSGDGSIGGASGLVKTNAGTLVIANANSYTGTTSITGGTLRIGDGGTSGSIAGSIDNSAALVFDRSDAVTHSGTISGTGTLTQRGTGTLILSGNNSHSGDTTASAGTLQLGSQTAAGTSLIVLGDTNTGADDVRLTLGPNSDRSGFANDILVASQGSGTATIKWIETGNTSSSGNGSITLERDTVFDATEVGGTGFNRYLLFNHALSGAGDLTLTATNGTRFLLEGDSPGYTGNLTLQSGAIFEPRNMLSATTGNDVDIRSGGQMRIQFGDTTIGGLNGAGDVRAESGSGSLTLGKGDANGNFSGVISQASSPTLSLTKTGAGTQILSGNSSYTGATTVSAGTLFVTGALGATDVTVESGATIGGSGIIGGSLSFGAGSNLDLTGATVGLVSSGVLSVSDSQSISLTDFAFANLLGWDWLNAEPGTYTLIDGGSGTILSGTTPTVSNPYDFGNGRSGYFQQGSLQVVIIPEPGAAMSGLFGALLLLCRRRRGCTRFHRMSFRAETELGLL